MLIRVCLAMATSIGFIAVTNADEKDSKGLNGTWAPQSGEFGGNKFPDEILKTIKLEIKDGTYAVMAGKEVDKGTAKIDASKKPKEMDITGTDGPNKGKTFPAIYELDGDTLKVCYDLSGKERPKALKTESGTMTFLVIYKRVKE
jgi:uncharacterized protein (TIGR03067 family)